MSRTTHRIAAKQAKRFTAAALSLPLCLAHARQSFFALRDVGQQRKYLRHQLAKLGVRGNVARWVTRRWCIDADLFAKGGR